MRTAQSMKERGMIAAASATTTRPPAPARTVAPEGSRAQICGAVLDESLGILELVAMFDLPENRHLRPTPTPR